MEPPHDEILKASYGKRKRGREKMSRKGSGRKRGRNREEGEEDRNRKTHPQSLVSCSVPHAPPQNFAIINMASTLEIQKLESK